MDNSVQLICSILDTKANVFGPIFLARSKGEAIRTFDQVVNDKRGEGTVISQYPDDFVLHCLGSFDAVKGIVHGGILENIARGTDFVKHAPVSV